ncbi:MAG: hypothetical protein SYC29_03985, partial [Planctomycetota bacterium]|nr:hypothetical protein [Planctomycetota bacterium]
AAPSTRLREALARAAPALDLMRRGSRQQYADFNLDYSRGFDLLLPHLSPMRTLSRIMYVDALVRVNDGDWSGAADRISATYHISAHCADDCIIISSLIGAAIFKVGDKAAQYGFDRAGFSDLDCAKMLRAVQGLETGDPLNTVESVAMEQELAIAWLQKHLGPESGRQNVPDAFQWLVEDERAGAFLAQMTDADFQAELDAYDRGMDRFVEAMMMEDRDAARAELARLSEELGDGEYGHLAKMLMPSLSRYYEQMCEVQDQIAARAEMLRALATGRIRPEDEANAALYYARGIALLRKIEPSRFEAICAYEAREITEPDETMLKTFEDGQAVIDLFREGSQKRRCDFAVLRPRYELPFCPEYLGGLRDAVRFLHADARRRLEGGEPTAAADRLAIGYRLVAHLEEDEPVLSALLAHRIFDRTHELAASALVGVGLKEKQRAGLLDAAELIGRKDPFGYISSLLGTRPPLGVRLCKITSTGEFNDERCEAAKAMVSRCDGDQLLYLLAILDTMARAGEEEEEQEEAGADAKDDRFAPLADVISLPELGTARRETSIVAPRLARGELDLFDGGEFPRFGRVVERMRGARGDLRRALRFLHPPDAPPADAASPGGAEER